MKPPLIERAFARLPVPMVLLFLGAALFVVWESQGWIEGARLFPQYIGLGTAALALLELADRARRSLTGAATAEGPGFADLADEEVERSAPFLRAALALFGWVLGLYALIFLVGLTLAVPVWVTLLLRLRHGAPWAAVLGIGGGLVGLILLLQWALMMRIPAGIWLG